MTFGGYLYADNGYPHGPRVFLGNDIQCSGPDEWGPCREVPIYGEDTSQLQNPGWVMFMVHGRGQLLLIGSALLMLWAIFVHLPNLWSWWKPRRKLIWPYRPAASQEEILVAIDSELYGWQWWHEAGRILFGLRRYDEALLALRAAKDEDTRFLRDPSRGVSLEGITALAGAWHDECIEYVKAYTSSCGNL